MPEQSPEAASPQIREIANVTVADIEGNGQFFVDGPVTSVDGQQTRDHYTILRTSPQDEKATKVEKQVLQGDTWQTTATEFFQEVPMDATFRTDQTEQGEVKTLVLTPNTSWREMEGASLVTPTPTAEEPNI